MFILEFIFLFIFTIVPLLISVAFFTLVERKVIAATQRRIGPNVIFFFGFLLPIADGLKAILKELIFPKRVFFFFFAIGPVLVFFLSIVLWVIIPLSWDVTFFDYNLSVFFFFVISGLGFYGILIASWSSNSKYASLAAFRAVAQLISYEIFIILSILPIILFTSSWNFIDIVFSQKSLWNIFIFLPLAIIFWIAILAETNRIPFDLTEAEAEIVAGYNIEYSGFIFALFFLGEYSSMIVNAIVFVLFFLGGWLPGLNFLVGSSVWLVLKVLLMCFLYVIIRATLPRYRYDQIMDLGWKNYLPLTIAIYYFLVNLLSFDISVFTIF